MTIAEIVSLCTGGGIIVLLTLIEITPIKINPWSAIARGIGKALNHDVMEELGTVKKNQAETQNQLMETQNKLEELARVDDERNANGLRERILKFNLEVMRKEFHTREDFVEILTVIDAYENYCKTHPSYPNSRAVIATENIRRVYRERLEKNDFFKADDTQ